MRRGKIYEWIPLYRGKWLQGSTRFELDPDERSVFIDFLCLAGADDGFIRANPTTPYPREYLAHNLVVPLELLERTIRKCVSVGKLTVLPDGIMYVVSWDDYRLDPRRKREMMARIGQEGDPVDPPNDQYPTKGLKQPPEEDKTHTLNDTERAAECSPQIRLVLGANEKASLDKAIDKLRTENARLGAEVKCKKASK